MPLCACLPLLGNEPAKRKMELQGYHVWNRNTIYLDVTWLVWTTLIWNTHIFQSTCSCNMHLKCDLLPHLQNTHSFNMGSGIYSVAVEHLSRGVSSCEMAKHPQLPSIAGGVQSTPNSISSTSSWDQACGVDTCSQWKVMWATRYCSVEEEEIWQWTGETGHGVQTSECKGCV